MKPIKKKTCKVCKSKYIPFLSTQVVCGTKCAIEHAKVKANAKQKKQDKAKKEELKTLPMLAAEAQKQVNRYIRARDYYKPCVSCGAMTDVVKRGGYWDAGHYRNRGSALHLRFNLLNIHKQCSKNCNKFLSGNVVEYRKELINRIGIKRLKELENDNQIRKFSREYLLRVKKIFSRRARFYEYRLKEF